MAVIRINAVHDRPQLHRGNLCVHTALARHMGPGPVIVMIHGYKYQPDIPDHCPHLNIMSMKPRDTSVRSLSWLRHTGFGAGNENEGLAIAFGWQARGTPWAADRKAMAAGRALAQVLETVFRQVPDRPVHILAHSMGTELVFEALHHLPAGAVNRIIAMTGASYQSRARRALATPAGRTAELVNVVSGENDPYDFLFERLIAPPVPGDRPIGSGLALENAVTLQLDCSRTLACLSRLGAPVAKPQRRFCHWSAYTRPGVLRFYNALMRQPDTWPLATLRQIGTDSTVRRWSRLIDATRLPRPLPLAQNAS